MLLIGSVLEGYLIGVGKLDIKRVEGLIAAAGLFVSGFILALPGVKMDLLGLGLTAVSLVFIFAVRALKKGGAHQDIAE